MAKDVPSSVRDSLSQAHTAVAQAMTAPDALPVMKQLQGLSMAILGMIQQGHQAQQPGMPGGAPGGPPPGGGMPPGGGAPGPQGNQGQFGPPQQGSAPGPAPAPMPGAGGQGLFPNSPQPNAQELAQFVASRAGS
jgi:hypothetical protein